VLAPPFSLFPFKLLPFFHSLVGVSRQSTQRLYPPPTQEVIVKLARHFFNFLFFFTFRTAPVPGFPHSKGPSRVCCSPSFLFLPQLSSPHPACEVAFLGAAATSLPPRLPLCHPPPVPPFFSFRRWGSAFHPTRLEFFFFRTVSPPAPQTLKEKAIKDCVLQVNQLPSFSPPLRAPFHGAPLFLRPRTTQMGFLYILRLIALSNFLLGWATVTSARSHPPSLIIGQHRTPQPSPGNTPHGPPPPVGVRFPSSPPLPHSIPPPLFE